MQLLIKYHQMSNDQENEEKVCGAGSPPWEGHLNRKKAPLFYAQIHSCPRSTVNIFASVGFFTKRMSVKLLGLHQHHQ